MRSELPYFPFLICMSTVEEILAFFWLLIKTYPWKGGRA